MARAICGTRREKKASGGSWMFFQRRGKHRRSETSFWDREKKEAHFSTATAFKTNGEAEEHVEEPPNIDKVVYLTN